MSIKDALDKIYKELKKNKHIDSPETEAEMLLALILGKPRTYVISHPEMDISGDAAANVMQATEKRKHNYPFAYISGEKEFYGLKFLVNETTLIPRPETEVMVDLVINIASGEKKYLVLDLGTGSGAIIISLAKKLGGNKNISFRASDISSNALETARRNAKHHRIASKIDFNIGSLLEPHLNAIKRLAPEAELVICANLPYLRPEDIINSPGIRYEPRIALEAGKDGLNVYQKLIEEIRILKHSCCALLEIDSDQTDKIKQIIGDDLPDARIDVIKDLGGRDRIVKISTKS